MLVSQTPLIPNGVRIFLVFLLLGCTLASLGQFRHLHAYHAVDMIPGSLATSRSSKTDEDPNKMITVTFFTMSLNDERYQEIKTALKSIILNTAYKMTLFCMVCESRDEEMLREYLLNIDTQKQYHAKFINACHQETREYILTTVKSWGTRNTHHNGYPGLAKFFIPLIMPQQVERTILLDTDIVVGEDISLLWKGFDSFASDTVIAFPPLNKRYFDRFCSCVGLLDLKRMRELGGWNHVDLSSGSIFGNERVPATLPTGDQTLYTLAWLTKNELFQNLSTSWNIMPYEVHAILSEKPFFGILHYNVEVTGYWAAMKKYYEEVPL